jgi:hypothetical protein
MSFNTEIVTTTHSPIDLADQVRDARAAHEQGSGVGVFAGGAGGGLLPPRPLHQRAQDALRHRTPAGKPAAELNLNTTHSPTPTPVAKDMPCFRIILLQEQGRICTAHVRSPCERALGPDSLTLGVPCGLLS